MTLARQTLPLAAGGAVLAAALAFIVWRRVPAKHLIAGALIGLLVPAGYLVTAVLGGDEFEPATVESINVTRGGEMVAQFYMGTLYDPDLKMSKIVSPVFDQSADWYSKAAGQGHQVALSNLALAYSSGKFTRVDYTRACYYALKLLPSAPGNGLTVKGDCYARGLGGTRTDQKLADAAYAAATTNGATRTMPAPAVAPIVPSLPPTVPAVTPPSLDPVPFKPQPPPLNPPPLQPPQDSSSDTQWGAMGFTADGSYSTVWRMHSQPEAEASVAKQCAEFGRGGCKVFSISGQECASLATFINRRYRLSYTAGGATYPEAQNNALERCNGDGRTRGRCKSRNTFCADGR